MPRLASLTPVPGLNLDRHMMPAGTLAQNMPRLAATASTAGTSGDVRIVPIVAQAGQSITAINITAGAVGSTTLTHSWAVLCDSARAVLHTVTNNTTDWTADTVRTWTLTGGPYAVTTTGLFYVAWSVTAVVMPSLLGTDSAPPNANQALTPTFGRVATGATTPPTIPTTFGAPAGGATGAMPLVWLT